MLGPIWPAKAQSSPWYTFSALCILTWSQTFALNLHFLPLLSNNFKWMIKVEERRWIFHWSKWPQFFAQFSQCTSASLSSERKISHRSCRDLPLPFVKDRNKKFSSWLLSVLHSMQVNVESIIPENDSSGLFVSGEMVWNAPIIWCICCVCVCVCA